MGLYNCYISRYKVRLLGAGFRVVGSLQFKG